MNQDVSNAVETHNSTVKNANDENGGFEFLDKKPLTKSLDDILETNVDEKFYLTRKNIGDMDTKQNLKTKLCNRLVDEKVVKGGEIINHSYTTSKQRPKLEDYIESYNGIVPTLTTRPDIMGYVENKDNKIRIRKLTPKECYRLMGFDDEDFEKASQVNSNMQLYHQAGNSIVVNVLEAIIGNIFSSTLKNKYIKKGAKPVMKLGPSETGFAHVNKPNKAVN